jgi:beta-glucosidase
MALSPQADISTEPRWSRISGTFGEYPDVTKTMVEAYVEGMQGSSNGLTKAGVAAVVKHWVGYGAAPEGFDGHNAYGQHSAVTDESLNYHIEPFLGAFERCVAGVMPTYTIPHQLTENGSPIEAVAGGFSHYLLTTLLRDQYGFEGFVLSDWAIYRDATEATHNPQQMQSPDDIAMPWGVETLSRVERIAKSVNAGVDQLGGEEDVEALASAVASGLVSVERIEEAAERLLRVKFELGLFDAPYVDEQAAQSIVGNKEHQNLALDAQRRALICLNTHDSVDPAAVKFVDWNNLDDIPAETTLVIRIDSPREPLHPNHFFGSRQHEGSLEYAESSDEFQTIKRLSETNRIILVIQMARPAIFHNLLPFIEGLYIDLGISDDVILDAVSGKFEPSGVLPFGIPDSMQSVLDGRSDVPGRVA